MDAIDGRNSRQTGDAWNIHAAARLTTVQLFAPVTAHRWVLL